MTPVVVLVLLGLRLKSLAERIWLLGNASGMLGQRSDPLAQLTTSPFPGSRLRASALSLTADESP